MHPDLLIARIAHPQLDVVTRSQLLAAGLTDHQIRSRLRREALAPLHPGVYLCGTRDPTFEQRTIGACMAAGNEAFASGMTAARIWELATTERIAITVPANANPRLEGIEVRRSRLVGRPHQTRRGALPVATIARTLLDMAAISTRDLCESVVDEALRRWTSPDRVTTYLLRDDTRNARGSGLLRELVEDRRTGIPESELETRAIRLISRYRLPEPVRQFACRINGRNVRFDLAYPSEHVAIELDGRVPHMNPKQWERDHDRHNATERSEWTVLHFTWKKVTEEPIAVVLTIADALGLKPSRWVKA